MKQVREFAGARINPPPTYAKPPAPPAPPEQVVRVGDIVDVYFDGDRLHRGVLVVKSQDGRIECEPLPNIDPTLIPSKEVCMTLEEIRAAKVAAETDIRNRLQELREATGMSPIGVDVRLLDMTNFGSIRRASAIGDVVIELEPI